MQLTLAAGEERKSTVRGANGNSRAEGIGDSVDAAPGRPVSLLEMPAMPARRRFTPEYKLKILEEAEQCTEPGQLSALLKREGLYSSYLTAWRKQREEGTLAARPAKQAEAETPLQQRLLEENQWLRQTNTELQQRLRQAEVTIQVQKKVSEIIKMLLNAADSGDLIEN